MVSMAFLAVALLVMDSSGDGHKGKAHLRMLQAASGGPRWGFAGVGVGIEECRSEYVAASLSANDIVLVPLAQRDFHTLQILAEAGLSPKRSFVRA